MRKLRYFDLLWICCCTSPQQIEVVEFKHYMCGLYNSIKKSNIVSTVCWTSLHSDQKFTRPAYHVQSTMQLAQCWFPGLAISNAVRLCCCRARCPWDRRTRQRFNTLTAYAFRAIETVNRKMDLEIDNVDNVEQCAATDRIRKNVPSAWSRLIDRSAV